MRVDWRAVPPYLSCPVIRFSRSLRLLAAAACVAASVTPGVTGIHAEDPGGVRLETRVVGSAGADQRENVDRREGEKPGDEAVALVRKGNAARQAGRLREAVASFRRAAVLAPRHYEIRVLLADTLRRVGRDEEALAEYGRAGEIDPTRAGAWTGRALILRHRQDYESAVAVLREGLVKVRADDRDALRLTLAETWRRQGHSVDAAQLFREIVTARPDDPQARAGLARVAEDRGDLDGAISGWDDYLALRQDDEAVFLRRRSVADLRAAILALEATVAARSTPGPAGRDGDGARPDPSTRTRDLAALWEEIGRLRGVAGDTRGAADACGQALEIDPARNAARRRLALALRGLDPVAAAREFRHLLKAVPGDGVALYNLVVLAAAGGDKTEERRAWRTLLEARPRDLAAARAFVAQLSGSGREVLLKEAGRIPGDGGMSNGDDVGRTAARLALRAMLLEAAGRGNEAAAALLVALRSDPTDPWVLDAASDLFAARPAFLEQVAALWRAGASADPAAAGGAADAVLRGRLLWWAGRTGEAIAELQRAVVEHPAAPVARAALAEAYRAIGHRPDLALGERIRTVGLAGARLSDHVDLALGLLESGRPGRAEAVARQTLDRWPGTAPALSVLGAALLEQGRLEEAAAMMAAAIEADPIDFFGLASGRYPLLLAALGRHLEARHALRGDVPPIPALVYGEAWKFARDLFRDRSYRDQDWNRWRTAGATVRTPGEAWRAVALMLRSLEDPYTRLRDPEETEAAWLGPRGENIAFDRVGRSRPYSRTVVVEDRGELGYIRLSNLSDPMVVEEVRAALLALREKAGIILDLRGNPGGFSHAADAIGDLIVGPGRKSGVDVGPEGMEDQITGGEGAITGAPMTVLVDEQTASAAERLARTLQESGRATLEGTSTHGKGLAQMSRVLPGGMTVLVSVAEMLGPDGRPVQGEGLTPRPKRQPGDDPGPALPAPPATPPRP